MKILAVIPARFASTRFIGKPLAMIGSKTMVEHVYDRCVESNCFSKIIIATDDARIVEAVSQFGGDAVMTSENHPSGTDRCFEALDLLKENFDGVVNIQGDEPFIQTAAIQKVVGLLKDSAQIASLVVKAEGLEQVLDPNKVKVVLSDSQSGLYFSRAAIPFQRDFPQAEWLTHQDYYIHLGIYGFATEVIPKLKKLSASQLEKIECLEQLRWLEAGFQIKLGIVNESPQGVDTPADLARLNASLSAKNG